MENGTGPTTVATFRQSYPLDFSLHDDNDQHVLYIDNDPMGHTVELAISNSSAQIIRLTAPTLGSSAAADNHHFELRFRPGTLAAAAQITLAETEWSLGQMQQNDGTISLYLLSLIERTLPPGAVLSLNLQHVSADGRDGTRGTRVELRYQQLVYGDEDLTPVNGRRLQQLSVINQRGRRNIPLHVSFQGGNTIFNDGVSPNTLNLRLTNAQREGDISLQPVGSAAPTRLILSFDTQPEGEEIEWALGTTSQVAAIQVAALNDPWEIRQETEGEAPLWILTPQTAISLSPGQHIQLTLTNIISSLPTGHTNLYLHYENVPGYWDGQFVVGIEKAPLVYRDNRVGVGISSPDFTFDVRGYNQLTDANAQFNSHFPYINNQAYVTGEKVYLRGGAPQGWQPVLTTDSVSRHVGIGTTEPGARMHILNANQDANGNTLVLGPTTQANLRLGYDQTYSWIQSHGGRPLAINPIGNTVGIGTTTPETNLHIRAGNEPTLKIQSDGTNEISGRVALRQSNNTGGDMIYDGRSTVEGLAFHLTNNEGGGPVLLPVDPPPVFFLSNHTQRLRNIGINTSTPTARLHINNDNSAFPALLVASPNASSWQLRIHNLSQTSYQVGMRVTNDGFFDVTNRANLASQNSARLNSTGTWTVASDRRFKEDIQPVQGILDKVMALQPVSFRYKGAESGRTPMVGFIAQDVETLFPHLVTDSEDKYLDYSGFGPLAIRALQELKQHYDDRIARLEQTVAHLLARLEGQGNPLQETVQ